MTPERLEEIRSDLAESRSELNCDRCGDYHLTHAEELLTEVDRLLAAIERVKALYRLDMRGDVCGIVMLPQDDGQYLDREEVLAALEG